MNIQLILVTASLVILAAYILLMCWNNRQVPDSLSASVFFLPPQGAWLWTVVIAAVVFALAPVLIGTTRDSVQFLAFFACAGLLFVAGCPLVKDKGDMAYRVHCASAVVCAVSAMTLVAVSVPWLMFGWIPWLAVFLWQTRSHHDWRTQIFWAEMTCFLITYAYVYIRIL